MAIQDFDARIDWTAFYAQHLNTPVKPAGQDKMHCLCPFHEERNPSFWFNTTNGCWKCETGCGGGNGLSFLQRRYSIGAKEAADMLSIAAGIDPSTTTPPAQATASQYTIAEYALEKGLDARWLREQMGLREGYKNGYIEIPYTDERGNVSAKRKRYHPLHQPRFLWAKGSKTNLYGLHRLGDIKAAGYCILCEGESDTQTLLYKGYPALGYPGASTFKTEFAKKLCAIPELILCEDGDDAGKMATARIAQSLLAADYPGKLKVLPFGKTGAKDPSGLYLHDRDGFRATLDALIAGTSYIDLRVACQREPEGLEGAPVQLRMPPGYRMDARGIYEGDDFEAFTWTPMLLTRALPGVMGDVKMEIAYHRGGQWRTARFMRKTLAAANEILALADLGIDVTSENRTKVVKYFSALERENVDLIPSVKRVTRYGWIGESGKHFYPGACDGVELDAEDFKGKRALLGTAKGDYAHWKSAMQPHRQRGLFRFIMAAAFAPPLLKILSQRIFILYNWGDSKGGKTAAMMCALSAWGDPDAMRVSFNATQVGIEKSAGFFSDLPFGLNERQLAGSKQEFIEKIVYMLSEGSGRVRGNRAGGLQEQTTWRSVILANGEEPLSAMGTQTGVSTRALEIYGRPFEEDEAAASRMYALIAAHHGHAGVDYIRKLIDADDGEIRRLYAQIEDTLAKDKRAVSSSHLASVAVVALADYLSSQWIWNESAGDAMDAALGTAREILAGLLDTRDSDVNEQAKGWLVDWILSNRVQFTDSYRPPRYGKMEEQGRRALIFPTILEREMKAAGFNYQKTLRFLAEQGDIETTLDGDKVRFTIRRRIEGSRVWMVGFNLPADVQIDISQFEEIDDDELPFS